MHFGVVEKSLHVQLSRANLSDIHLISMYVVLQLYLILTQGTEVTKMMEWMNSIQKMKNDPNPLMNCYIQ